MRWLDGCRALVLWNEALPWNYLPWFPCQQQAESSLLNHQTVPALSNQTWGQFLFVHCNLIETYSTLEQFWRLLDSKFTGLTKKYNFGGMAHHEWAILQLHPHRPGLWMQSRLEVTLLWYKPLSAFLIQMQTTWFTQQKQRGLHQNKVTSSLAAIQWPGHRADNCKMVYYWEKPPSSKWFSE